MNLYDLGENIAKAQSMLYVDEDGILQGHSDMIAELDSLLLSKTDKIEALAIYHKTETAKAAMITVEIKSLQSRQKAHKVKAESLKAYLANYVTDKMETPKVKISFSNSEKLSYSENFLAEDLPIGCQRIKVEPEASAIKALIKSGSKFKEVQLVKNKNIQIK